MLPRRIITNGKKYRIQRRWWGFWWITYCRNVGDDEMSTREPYEFDTLEEAKKFITKETSDIWVLVDN